ncbi:MAG TPA: antitoxin family protein [Pirellulales bacterium]|nr:antitoxin family protein [Pirellulales bacterium]
MTITVEATYEDGTLRLAEPLPLKQHEKVRVTVHAQISPILQAYGIMGWNGSAELAEFFALDPAFDPQEG